MINFSGVTSSKVYSNNNNKQKNPSMYSENIQKPKNIKNKIGFYKGAKFVAQGFYEQAKDIITGIIKNPIKTAATVLGTTGALLALPLVGIPSAVGGAVMALGFGTVGVIKLISNTTKAVKHNKNGQYEEAKKDFKNIGASGVDLALSLPFVPKAIKSIKEFAKYGKIGINTAAIADLKNTKGLKAKYNVLNGANKELSRSYNYQAVVDEQLKKLNVTDAEKAAIKQELLDFNVPEDKILNVALEKLKKRDGYDFEIKLTKEATEADVLGYHSNKNGNIVIKDYSKPDLPKTGNSNPRIQKVEGYDVNNYKVTIYNPETGEQTFELMNKKVYDDYKALCQKEHLISRKGKDILTLVHEYEHLNQEGIRAMQYGNKTYATASGREVNRNIARVKGSLSVSEANQAGKYQFASQNYTSSSPVSYLENELEVGARLKEAEALNSPQFQRLENVFQNIDDFSNYNSLKDITPTVIQAHNASC